VADEHTGPAPVSATSTAEIAAGPDVVWDLITDVERWPEWNPEVRSVTLAGDVAPGSEFRWRSGSTRITSTFVRLERPAYAEWTGRTMGVRARHVWRLEAHEGGTRVTTEESFDGLLARLLRRRLQQTLQRALDDGLVHLRRAAEATA
jgi:hypothetical protein